jgi:L-amino acid N-acyltransferase YncA
MGKPERGKTGLRAVPGRELTIRDATPEDLAAITAIYAHHVLTGTGSFETEPPTEAEIGARMAKVAARRLPWIVATGDDDAVLGYAYAGAFRERAAYAATVENSVYVAADAQGVGVGRALLEALLLACKATGMREVLAVIGDSENVGSRALHAACGFRLVGVLEKVGHKFGRDLDVVLMQNSLAPDA